MTTEQDARLPLDEEIDAVIAAHESGDTEALAAAALEVGDAQKFAWGMGRALKRAKARYDALGEEAVKINEEFDRARQRLAPSIKFLEEQLDAMALERRKSGAGNFLDVPGVGRWSTKAVPAGWDIKDPGAVIEALDADERAQFVYDVPQLRAADYRKHLDATGEVPDGVERRPERISVSHTLAGTS